MLHEYRVTLDKSKISRKQKWQPVQKVKCVVFAGSLGTTYYEQGQLDLAILHSKQAIACDSGFVEAYNNLVMLLHFYFKFQFESSVFCHLGEGFHCEKMCFDFMFFV